jgi:hypothetical protein
MQEIDSPPKPRAREPSHELEDQQFTYENDRI